MATFDMDEKRQIFSALIANIGAFVVGMILGWSSPVQDMFINAVVSIPVYNGDVRWTFVPVFSCSAAVGSLIAGNVAALIGHRYGMAMSEVMVGTGWMLLTVPKHFWMLTVGRVFQGVGVGIMCVIIPSYVGDISSPKLRGKLKAMFQVFVAAGILYAFVFSLIGNYVAFNMLCCLWTVVHAVGVFFIPESPYFFIRRNENDKAIMSLIKLRGKNTEDISRELTILKIEVEEQIILTNFKNLLIGIGFMICHQGSGIGEIIFYMSDIFESLEPTSPISPEVSSIIIAIIHLVMTFVAIAVIEKTSRRKCLIISIVLMGLSLVGLTVYVTIVKGNPDMSYIYGIPLALITTFMSASAFGFGFVPCVVLEELLFNGVKSNYGRGLVNASNWIFLYFVTYYHYFTHNFLPYNVIFLLAVVFMYLFIPKTKKTMQSQST